MAGGGGGGDLMGGVEDDRRDSCPLCVFKDMAFFDDYSNPTKDPSANWLAYHPRAVFLSLKHNRRPPTLINLQVPLLKKCACLYMRVYACML